MADRRGQSDAWEGSSKNSTGTGGGSRRSRCAWRWPRSARPVIATISTSPGVCRSPPQPAPTSQAAGHGDAAPDTEDVACAASGLLHSGGAGQAFGDLGNEDRGKDGGAGATAAEQAHAEHDEFGDAVEQGA